MHYPVMFHIAGCGQSHLALCSTCREKIPAMLFIITLYIFSVDFVYFTFLYGVMCYLTELDSSINIAAGA